MRGGEGGAGTGPLFQVKKGRAGTVGRGEWGGARVWLSAKLSHRPTPPKPTLSEREEWGGGWGSTVCVSVCVEGGGEGAHARHRLGAGRADAGVLEGRLPARRGAHEAVLHVPHAPAAALLFWLYFCPFLSRLQLSINPMHLRPCFWRLSLLLLLLLLLHPLSSALKKLSGRST